VKNLWGKIKVSYFYYKERGLYKYIGWNALKIITVYPAIILLLYLTGKYLFNIDYLFQLVIDNLRDKFIFILFFVSESFLGLIPIDLFVIWAKKFESPFIVLTFLGILSYTGGIISYMIGQWFGKRPKIKKFIERKFAKYFTFVKKWGGAFLIMAALFPFSPYSSITIIASLLRFPFTDYLLFSIARIIRFIIQGMIFFQVLNFDFWEG